MSKREKIPSSVRPTMVVINAAEEAFKSALQTAQVKTVCKPGCHWCCYEAVGVTNREADFVWWGLQKLGHKVTQEVQARVKEWGKWWKKEGKEMDAEAYRRAKQLCSLCVDGECIVYDYRPLPCRLYIQIQTPDNCKPDRDVYDGAISIPEVSVAQLAFSQVGKLQNLTGALGRRWANLPQQTSAAVPGPGNQEAYYELIEAVEKEDSPLISVHEAFQKYRELLRKNQTQDL